MKAAYWVVAMGKPKAENLVVTSVDKMDSPMAEYLVVHLAEYLVDQMEPSMVVWWVVGSVV